MNCTNFMAHMARWTGLAVAVAVLSSSTPSLALTGGVSGVSAGAGSLLVAGTSTKFHPRGFTSIGVLYPAQYASTLCSALDPGSKAELAAAETAMTQHTDTQLNAMKTHWNANTVRFQVSQGALTYEHENGGSLYTTMVATVINEARKLDLVTIVSMQTEGYSCTPKRANGNVQKLPDQLTKEAWAQLIPSLTLNKGIILEVFNEPQTSVECSMQSWTYWATGCGTGSSEGMKTVGAYVRSLAGNTVLLFDADGNGGTFGGFTPPTGMPGNSAYTIHPYFYTDGSTGWDTRFGSLQTAGHTVIITEWNESANCPHAADPNQTIAGQLVNTYLPAHNSGLMLFSWDAPGAGVLVNSSTFAPIDSNSGCSYFTGATLGLNYFEAQSGGN
ncbi:MAG: cellulase family glycosylhydrolase [Bryocella sp.]